MMRTVALVLLIAGCCAEGASAVDLVNVQALSGPLGPKRADNKFLPGDIIYLTYDIVDITADPKSSGVAYQTTLEILGQDGKPILDQNKKPLYKPQTTAPERLVLLGGNRIRSSAFAAMGTAQDAGKYQLKITVNDLVGKQEKSFTYPFEVLPRAFGIVQPATPAVAFAGSDFGVVFSVVGMAKDKKTEMPDVTFTLHVLDEKGAEVTTKPWTLNIQRFHNPLPGGMDLTKKEVVPVAFTLYLNRPGTYVIQLDAVDEASPTKEKRQMKFPLKVLDSNDFSGK